jgi:hypothetical protein
MRRDPLRRLLRRRPDVLDAMTVDLIFERARRSLSWLG